MKEITFLGDSLKRLREFPEDARAAAGRQLQRVQFGGDPLDWKPMTSIGPGVREIRVREESGAYRVIYIASIGDRIYVLHAFKKTTRKTARRDLDVAAMRLKSIGQE